jgi:hypothetical protein
MKMRQAMELPGKKLENPKAKSNRKQAKQAVQARWDCQKGRT